MATAGKKISRKELRQPDWFHLQTERAVEGFARHKSKIFIALAAVVVLLAVILAWQLFKANQHEAASKEFGAALSLYQAQKYREALAGFQKAAEYRWSRYAALAHLYAANSHFNLDEFKPAAASAQRFLAATSPGTIYRQIALMTLGSAEEQMNDCQAAIDHYSEAERIQGAYQQQARLGKARCAQQNGDLQAAIAAYREYVKETPEPSVALRLAELEAKAGQGKPEPKAEK